MQVKFFFSLFPDRTTLYFLNAYSVLLLSSLHRSPALSFSLYNNFIILSWFYCCGKPQVGFTFNMLSAVWFVCFHLTFFLECLCTSALRDLLHYFKLLYCVTLHDQNTALQMNRFFASFLVFGDYKQCCSETMHFIQS